jgi:TolB-like protein
MVATVSPWADQSVAQANAPTPDAPPTDAPEMPKTSGPRLSSGFTWAVGAALSVTLVLAFLFHGKVANNNPAASPAPFGIAPPQKSIAVLPFLDLTDEMNQEPFADGMTEELIDKLSKIPGLQVPPPTSSFSFKGKLWPRSHGTPQMTIADIAKTLGVAYVLDGSVRKSGARLRVAARLIRADNGYVVWSETYDRPFNDILMVQDDIAGEVTKALKASIEATPHR